MGIVTFRDGAQFCVIYLSFVKKTTVPATSRLKKPSQVVRSPFHERAVRVTAKANTVDKQIYYWVLDTAEKNK